MITRTAAVLNRGQQLYPPVKNGITPEETYDNRT